MTKLTYNYSPENGEYIGKGEADESPLEPGVYHFPAHSTEIAPPAISDHEVSVFSSGAWLVLADYRGTVYYTTDGASHTITEIGALLPDGALLTAPEQTAEQIATARIAAIDARLAEIDQLSARPAREASLALLSGATVDSYVTDKLAALEAEAVALRAERKTLVGG